MYIRYRDVESLPSVGLWRINVTVTFATRQTFIEHRSRKHSMLAAASIDGGYECERCQAVCAVHTELASQPPIHVQLSG